MCTGIGIGKMLFTITKNVIFVGLLMIPETVFGVFGIPERSPSEKPTVMVAVLVRNKEFILPWFLGHLENLDYPKHNIEVWIRSDHNIDHSSVILNQWVTAVRMEYQDVDLLINDTITGYDDEDGPCHWSRDRMNRVIALRQEALETARRKRIDYLFMLDADIVIENKDTLNILMAINRTVVSPMMSPPEGEAYCNFWGAMTDNGYYERSNTYFDIIRRSITGVFECALVHSAVLIDMHSSFTGKFSYSPRSGPEDDMIIFAHSVKEAGEKMYIDNREYFGRIILPNDILANHAEQFKDAKLEAIAFREPLRPSPHVYLPEPVLDTMGFDQIYVINLKRRPKRKKQMIATLKELGLKAHFIEAVDGRELNMTYLTEIGIRMLPEYKDRFEERRLTMGEVGCFLSHYYIWNDVLDKSYRKVMILEDDILVKASFREETQLIMEEAEENVPEWDLIYLGRISKSIGKEDRVLGTSRLVFPQFSIWAVGYILSYTGAYKLVDRMPLGKMIPVDDYITLMNDQHTSNILKRWYAPRNLRALAADPTLLSQTYMWGEEGHVSDTAHSCLVSIGSRMDDAVPNYCSKPFS